MHDNKLISIWKYLHQEEGLQFLMTRRLNQDPVENFFDSIRQQGGNCYNPTPLQFSRCFKKLFHDISPFTGNCSNDLDKILTGLDNSQVACSLEETGSQPEGYEVDVSDYKSSLDSNVIYSNECLDVCGRISAEETSVKTSLQYLLELAGQHCVG